MEQISNDYDRTNYRFYKWSNGVSYDKTKRTNVNKSSEKKNSFHEKERNINTQKLEEIQKQTNLQEINDSTHLKQNLIDNERISILSNNTQYTRQSNKRTTHNELLLQRDPMIQKSVNPFITRSNYLEDLNNEHDFLRPKDSNFE